MSDKCIWCGYDTNNIIEDLKTGAKEPICLSCYGPTEPSSPSCPHCSVPWSEHMGIEQQCEERQEMQAEIDRLREQLKVAVDTLTDLSKTARGYDIQCFCHNTLTKMRLLEEKK